MIKLIFYSSFSSNDGSSVRIPEPDSWLNLQQFFVMRLLVNCLMLRILPQIRARYDGILAI